MWRIILYDTIKHIHIELYLYSLWVTRNLSSWQVFHSHLTDRDPEKASNTNTQFISAAIDRPPSSFIDFFLYSPHYTPHDWIAAPLCPLYTSVDLWHVQTKLMHSKPDTHNITIAVAEEIRLRTHPSFGLEEIQI